MEQKKIDLQRKRITENIKTEMRSEERKINGGEERQKNRAKENYSICMEEEKEKQLKENKDRNVE